jgi:hypothetical protein
MVNMSIIKFLTILGFISIVTYFFVLLLKKDKNNSESPISTKEKSSQPEVINVDYNDPLPKEQLYRYINKRTGEYAKTFGEAVSFRDMDFNSFEPVSFEAPKIPIDKMPTGSYLELYELVIKQELTKKYLKIFPFGLQFLRFDEMSENYAFEQFEKKYPAGVGKMLPIMHINKGKDTLYWIGDESFLYHQELDVVDNEFKKYATSQEVWDKVIKPDIESYCGVKIEE